MKHLRDIIGYLLGLVLFVGLMPTLMWLASGRPAFWLEERKIRDWYLSRIAIG